METRTSTYAPQSVKQKLSYIHEGNFPGINSNGAVDAWLVDRCLKTGGKSLLEKEIVRCDITNITPKVDKKVPKKHFSNLLGNNRPHPNDYLTTPTRQSQKAAL